MIWRLSLLAEIDKLAAAGLMDTKAQEFLADSFGGTVAEEDHGQVWHVVKLWLVHFFPDSFRLETGQEVLVKGRELPKR